MIVPGAQDSWNVAEKVTAAKLNKNVRDPINFLRAVPAANIYQANAQTIASASTNTVTTLDAVAFDTDGMADLANSRLVVQTPGLYNVVAAAAFAANATGHRLLAIYKNTGSNAIARCQIAAAATATMYNCSALVRFSAGDTIYTGLGQNSGANLATSPGASSVFLYANWVGA